MQNKILNFRHHFMVKITAVSFLFMLPLWVFNIFPHLHSQNIDFIFNAIALNQFSAQLWSGELYPRWMVKANNGFGSPIFALYAPVSFYIGSLFAWLKPIDPLATGRLGIAMAASLPASGWTMWLWLRQKFPAKQAQDGAWIYAFFPYKFIFLYVKVGGLATVWAMVWSPLLLLAVDRMIARRPGSMGLMALCWGLMILTHPFVAICFMPVPLCYGLFVSPSAERLRLLSQLFVAYLLGIGLAAIFLVPLMKNHDFINSAVFVSGKFDYRNELLHFSLSSLFGVLYIMLPVIGLFAVKWRENDRQYWTRENKCWLFLLAATFFFVTPLSLPLWDLIPPMRYLQFPYRVYTSSLFIACCMMVPMLSHPDKREMAFRMVINTSLCCLLLGIYFGQPFDLQKATDVINHQEIKFYEYHTKWEKPPYDLPPPMEMAAFASGNGKISGFKESARHLHLDITVSSPAADIAVHRFYFPSWEITPNVPGVTILPSVDHGLLTLHLPQGHYDLTLNQTIEGEREGAWISLLSLIMIASFCLFPHRRSAVRKAAPPAPSLS